MPMIPGINVDRYIEVCAALSISHRPTLRHAQEQERQYAEIHERVLEGNLDRCVLCLRPMATRKLANSHIIPENFHSMVDPYWVQDNNIKGSEKVDVARLLCHAGGPKSEKGRRCEEDLSYFGEEEASKTLAGRDWHKELGPQQLEKDGWLVKLHELSGDPSAKQSQFSYSSHLFHAISSTAYRILVCQRWLPASQATCLKLLCSLRNYVRYQRQNPRQPYSIILGLSSEGMGETYHNKEPWLDSAVINFLDGCLVYFVIRGCHFITTETRYASLFGNAFLFMLSTLILHKHSQNPALNSPYACNPMVAHFL